MLHRHCHGGAMARLLYLSGTLKFFLAARDVTPKRRPIVCDTEPADYEVHLTSRKYCKILQRRIQGSLGDVTLWGEGGRGRTRHNFAIINPKKTQQQKLRMILRKFRSVGGTLQPRSANYVDSFDLILSTVSSLVTY